MFANVVVDVGKCGGSSSSGSSSSCCICVCDAYYWICKTQANVQTDTEMSIKEIWIDYARIL